MRHGFVGNQLFHLFQLLNGFGILRIALEGDAQVEPRVRNCRVLFLRFLQLGDSFRSFRRTQQRQAVVNPLTCRIRIQVQRLLKLAYRLQLRRRILVKRLAQIARLRQRVALLHFRLGLISLEPAHQPGCGRQNQDTPDNPSASHLFLQTLAFRDLVQLVN